MQLVIDLQNKSMVQSLIVQQPIRPASVPMPWLAVGGGLVLGLSLGLVLVLVRFWFWMYLASFAGSEERKSFR